MIKIRNILKDHYDLDIINVLPQKGGWAALAYKVYDNKAAYFLKVYEKSRASTAKWTAHIDQYVPILVWLMHNSSLKGKIPVPILTKKGDYKCEDDAGVYLLYEYIDGETIGDKDLNKEQIYHLSVIVTELHAYGEEIPIQTDMVKENFHVPFLPELRNSLDEENNLIPVDLREVMNPHIEQIRDMIDTVEQLSVRLKTGNVRMALCHSDLHNWNLMQSEPHLMLIDWEGLKLAPVEADMMFLVDKPYFAEFLSIYQNLHKDFVMNPDVLQFYKGRRKLEDVWEFMEQLLFDKQDGEERVTTISLLATELRDIDV
ncbi:MULTISPECIES: aminoglycoside phosphotransferase family protein [unclassified Paenibacillus]|uniref:aminoglycoside phosphotransferase family protein n=1 Tax=unclassified Paenibacillus TaxID=185978 RepID=UPI00363944D7